MPLEKLEFSSDEIKEKEENVVYTKDNKIINLDEHRKSKKNILEKGNELLNTGILQEKLPEERKICSIEQWKSDTTYTNSVPSPMNDNEIIDDEDIDDEIPDDIKQEFKEKKAKLEKILQDLEEDEFFFEEDEFVDSNIEYDYFYIPMKPKREYEIKIKIESVEKAKPSFIVPEDI